MISTLQRATCVLVAAMALVPTSAWGLWALCLLYLMARTLWSGVITLRAAVWRGNYEKSVRAAVAGRIATVQSLVMAATGLMVGLAMDYDARAFHLLFPLLAVAGIAGNAVYRRVRLRGEPALLARERNATVDRPSLNPMSVIAVLRADRAYRTYMGWMFVFGFGNLLVSFPLTKAFAGASYLEGILVRTAIPFVMIPLATPIWSRLLARRHVVEFRAIHAWSFVAATFTLVMASVTDLTWIYYLAAVILGIAYAGGMLAWNIGHSDFASPDRDATYMSVHVTLNGLRGFMSPFIAFALWEWLAPQGLAPVVFLICLATNTIGALGFVAMAMHRRRARLRAVAVATAPGAIDGGS